MMGIEDQVAQWFTYLAYQPLLVYSLVVTLMFASSFGLPLPEEVTLVGASFAAYAATHSDQFPPPTENSHGVDPFILATICLFAVCISDSLIYWIGSRFGDFLNKSPRGRKRLQGRTFQRVQNWIRKYGSLAPCIFRFTPGLRFPGHMMCGVMKIGRWKFFLATAIPATLTVPTQIILISTYGEVILNMIRQAKHILLVALVAFTLVYLFYAHIIKKSPTSL